MDQSSTQDFDSSFQGISRNSPSPLTLYGEAIENNCLNPFKPSEICTLTQKYKTTCDIYQDPLAATVVSLAVDNFGRNLAIKQINKNKLKYKHNIELAKIELTVHLSLSKLSTHIVEAIEYFENEKAFYLIMERCDNPNYFSYRLENKLKEFTNEDILKHYSRSILLGLAEIHKHNIIHCDIKLENFLLFKNVSKLNASNDSEDSVDSNDDDDYENDVVKICDFGLSHIISNGQKKTLLKYACGTHGYNAPEKKNDSYIDTSVDIWSFGICLYQMAVAYKPTAIRNYKYGSGPIPYIQSNWKKFDYKNLQNLIESCLRINPEERITSEQALKHPWFSNK